MRDLELRGAGNILGTQQSGHIATVGYELYCELLEQAIRGLKKLPAKESLDVTLDLPIEAFLPRTYVPDMRTKIDLYRRLARVAQQTELDELTSEFSDRFGPLPAEAERLLLLAQMRIWAHLWKISTIHLEDGFIVFDYSDRKQIELLVARSRKRLRVVDDQSAYLPINKGVANSAQVVEEIQGLLRPA
jgi:transcription-repair coupling factor (superfamily II helicase)